MYGNFDTFASASGHRRAWPAILPQMVWQPARSIPPGAVLDHRVAGEAASVAVRRRYRARTDVPDRRGVLGSSVARLDVMPPEQRPSPSWWRRAVRTASSMRQAGSWLMLRAYPSALTSSPPSVRDSERLSIPLPTFHQQTFTPRPHRSKAPVGRCHGGSVPICAILRHLVSWSV